MNEIEQAIGDVFASPQLTETIRRIKAAGGSKAEIIRRVTQATKGKTFMRSGLLLVVDRIWAEEGQP